MGGLVRFYLVVLDCLGGGFVRRIYVGRGLGSFRFVS